jgi:DNA repair protein RadC
MTRSNQIVATRISRARTGLDAWVYRLSSSIRFEIRGQQEETTFVVVTSVRMDGEEQTLIYPSDEAGDVLSYNELPGSYSGGSDHEKAIRGAGWALDPKSIRHMAPSPVESRDCVGIHTHTPVDVPAAIRAAGAREEDTFSRSIRWSFDGRTYHGVGRRGSYLIVPSGQYETGTRFYVYNLFTDDFGGVHRQPLGEGRSHVEAIEIADRYDEGRTVAAGPSVPVKALVAEDFPTQEAAIKHALSQPDGQQMFVYYEAGKFHLASPGNEPVNATPVAVFGHGRVIQIPPSQHLAEEDTAPVIYEDGARGEQPGKPWPAPETVVAREGKAPRFADVKDMLLRGLRERGWTVVENLKVPHATSPDGRTRLWFKSQAIYINDPGTDPRQFVSAHSLTMDMREYQYVDQLLSDVARRESIGEAREERSSAKQEAPEAGAPQQGDCLPWVRVTRDPERYEACLAEARRIGPIDNPRKVYDLLAPTLIKEDQEVMLVVLVDVRRQLRGVAEVHRGQRSRVGVGVTDVMRVVIATGSEGFAIVHNHPSGSAKPSEADLDLTKTIEDASKPYGKDLTFLDHVIIGSGQFYSVREHKLYKVG